MSRADHELARAEAQAAAARRQLAQTLVDIQTRLSPRALARGAVEEMRDTALEIAHAAMDAVKRNPSPWLGIGAAISFVVAKRWLGHAVHEAPPDTAADLADDPLSPSPPNPGTRDDR